MIVKVGDQTYRVFVNEPLLEPGLYRIEEVADVPGLGFFDIYTGHVQCGGLSESVVREVARAAGLCS